MKKVLAVLFAVVLMIAPCVVGVGAAGALTADEQRVIDFLSDEYKIGKTNYHIPDEYINQAKNYFLTIDVTKNQADDIIKEVQKAIDELKATTLPTQEFDMKALPYEVKEDILKAGQDACNVVGLNLAYNVATAKVEITKPAVGGGAPTVVFNDEPVIKTTGADVNASAIVITFASLAALVAAVAFVSKKVKLF